MKKTFSVPLHLSILFFGCNFDITSSLTVELSQTLLEHTSKTSGTSGIGAQSQHSQLRSRHAALTIQPCNVPYPVYPISFAFPKELMWQQSLVRKARVVAAVVPGRPYAFSQQEEYYGGYTTALFGLTWKKRGWDCMRHYEIMASGALPYMPDIADCPQGTMFSVPGDLFKQVLEMPGVNHTAIMAKELDNDAELINETFDILLYERLLNKVMAHFRSHLTSVEMAKHMLRAADISTEVPPKIIFLAHDHTDYQAETLFHGLRSLFGKAVIDYPKRPWMYHKPARTDEDQARRGMYGKGFSYAFTLPDLAVDRSKVEQQIKEHFFDVVVYGITHYAYGYEKLYFLDVVKEVYSAKEVLFVDGSDLGHNETHELFSDVCGKQGTCFRRELECA